MSGPAVRVGFFNTATNCKLGVVPNNGTIYNGQATTFTVEIPISSAVTLNTDAMMEQRDARHYLGFLEHCRRPGSHDGGCLGEYDQQRGHHPVEWGRHQRLTDPRLQYDAAGRGHDDAELAGGGGSTVLEQAVGGLTLTNDSTIQGAGIIGNGGLSLINAGTINANSRAKRCSCNGMREGSPTPACWKPPAAASCSHGVTVNNAGGNITANAGSTVQLFGNTDIQGGTLNNERRHPGTPAGTRPRWMGAPAAR